MACSEAPGLVIEKNRLKTIGGNFLGIVGDSGHSFGYHLCAPPKGDYSLAGPRNAAVGPYSAAIDIGMNWGASRQWLPWLITEIREDRIHDIAEVIGSLDGKNVRYWSDSSGWAPNGVPYTGEGHDTWTHVAIYRSTAKDDHRILDGWTATGYTGGDMANADEIERTAYNADAWGAGIVEGLPTVFVRTSSGKVEIPNALKTQLDRLEEKVDKLTAALAQPPAAQK